MNWSKCVPASDSSLLDSNFFDILKKIEYEYGESLDINSAYRSYEWEIQHGRVGTSSHCKGLAVDIHTYNSNSRLRLVMAALKFGIRRIGIYKSFVHLDSDSSKPSCIFLG